MKASLQQAFSLIEVMVVVVIIGLLASVVTVGVMGFLADSRITAAKTQISQFMEALDLYKLTNGKYPSKSQGLEALLEPRKGRDEGYLKGTEIPKDPWGHEYEYRSTGSKCKIICYGANGEEGGTGEDEDIVVTSGSKDN